MTGLLEGEVFASTSTITFTLHRARRDHLRRLAIADVRRATLNGADARLSHRRRRPAAAARPRGRQRPGRRGQHHQHRHRRGHPAHGRPHRQARLRLDQPRARRGPPRVGLLRPARPQGPAPLRRDRARRRGGHLQRRARVDRGRRRRRTPGSGPSPTPRACRRTSSWSTPARSTRCAASTTATTSGFYCRQSLVPILERDLDELVTLTRQGLAFFGERFALPVPAGALRPGLRAQPRRRDGELGLRDLRRRPAVPHSPDPRASAASGAEFIFHEMAHMWFGDLVTMQWWDDLWLNEAFASWAANWGMAGATRVHRRSGRPSSPRRKRTAYEMDMGPAQPPDPRRGRRTSSAAMANFDAITYVKGQSVLHQLVAYIGEDAFVEGLRDYFSRYAFANTRLDDLMDVLRRAPPAATCPPGPRPGSTGPAPTSSRWSATSCVVETHRRPGAAPAPPRHRGLRHRPATTLVAGRPLRRTRSTGPRTAGRPARGDLRLVNAGDSPSPPSRPTPTSLRADARRASTSSPTRSTGRSSVATAGQLLLLGERRAARRARLR